MNIHNLTRTIFGAALLFAFAACTQDELADDNGASLPEGKYPLEIGSISLAAEVDEQPWRAGAPQTRVSENDDRNSSHWDVGDVIYAKTDGAQEAGTFRIENAQGSLTVQKPTYWTKTTENVTAWFPGEGTVELADQSNKLAYVLQAVAGNASYNQPIELGFTHQLAKVRVTLQGDQAKEVTDVKIKSYTTCTNAQGVVSTGGATEGWITMMKTERNGATCWEANVVPDHAITAFQVNGVEGTLDNGGITPLAAKVNTITLTVGDVSLQPVDGKFTINQGDDVLIKDYEGTEPIVVNGDATITIENVKLTTDGTVMEIANGSDVTLNVKGTGNEFISTTGSGIGAGQDTNITIKGMGQANSSLLVDAGNGNNVVGIGFVLNDREGGTYGDINILAITLTVYGGDSDAYGMAGAAIGTSSRTDLYDYITVQCGDINIYEASITANSKNGAACIGTAYWNDNDLCKIENISIKNSTITANSETDGYGNTGACIGFGVTGSGCNAAINKIEIDDSLLNLTTNAPYKVGKGSNYGTATMTEGIFVDGNDKGKDGWNP